MTHSKDVSRSNSLTHKQVEDQKREKPSIKDSINKNKIKDHSLNKESCLSQLLSEDTSRRRTGGGGGVESSRITSMSPSLGKGSHITHVNGHQG